MNFSHHGSKESHSNLLMIITMATASMETTNGLTYSMARAIRATHGKKVAAVDAIICICKLLQ